MMTQKPGLGARLKFVIRPTKMRQDCLYRPLLKDRARISPPFIYILINLSSARISYTEISPDANPIPTTSIAGDCVRAVTGYNGVAESLGSSVINNFELEKVCIQVLHGKFSIVT